MHTARTLTMILWRHFLSFKIIFKSIFVRSTQNGRKVNDNFRKLIDFVQTFVLFCCHMHTATILLEAGRVDSWCVSFDKDDVVYKWPIVASILACWLAHVCVCVHWACVLFFVLNSSSHSFYSMIARCVCSATGFVNIDIMCLSVYREHRHTCVSMNGKWDNWFQTTRKHSYSVCIDSLFNECFSDKFQNAMRTKCFVAMA